MKSKAKLIICVVAFAGTSGCDIGCANEVIASTLSPSQATKAVVFNRNCGATTGFNTQVSVFAASTALPSEAGNVLIVEGSVPVNVSWVSESALTISGLGTARIFKQQPSVFGVAITYGK